MTDRERLIALLKSNMKVLQAAGTSATATLRLADHLIANGVTFATDNNVGSRWIPVTERLPEEHKLVLCLWIQMGDGFRYGFARLQRENVWWVLNEGMPEVTHWMPLTEAPKEVE